MLGLQRKQQAKKWNQVPVIMLLSNPFEFTPVQENCYSFLHSLVVKPTDCLINIFGNNPKYSACVEGSEEE